MTTEADNMAGMTHRFPWHDGSDIAFTPAGQPKTQICFTDEEAKAGVSPVLPVDDESADTRVPAELAAEGMSYADYMELLAEQNDPGEGRGLTDEEAERVLRGDYAPLGVMKDDEP